MSAKMNGIFTIINFGLFVFSAVLGGIFYDVGIVGLAISTWVISLGFLSFAVVYRVFLGIQEEL